MLEDVLNRLQETWGWTTEEINDVRAEMANYVLAALMDSTIRKEAEDVCLESEE